MNLKRIIWMITIFALGCKEYRYTDPSHYTVPHLCTLSWLAGRALDKGVKLDECQSVEDFLIKAKKAGAIEEKILEDARGYDEDGWNRKYHWQVYRGNLIIVRIISNGPNRNFENGDGDDLFAEIVYSPKENKPITRIKTKKKFLNNPDVID